AGPPRSHPRRNNSDTAVNRPVESQTQPGPPDPPLATVQILNTPRERETTEMTEFIEFWERWVASTREPIDYAQNAKVRRETDSTTIRRDDLFGTHCDVVTRPGRKLITFTFERDGEEFIC